MRKLFGLLIFGLSLSLLGGAQPTYATETDYLYYRDANVPPFQKSREFFDMPNRSGLYEVTMVSDTVGPLTFRIVRVHGDSEETMQQRRSYKVGAHEFQASFNNPEGADDLIVEIANSNPATVAKVAVFVVELPNR
ncbi:hypothetical protein [Mariprofundus sp. KV]|uniref:hypothetical protein n=1 Tax=Mariprofundus sp. KV TaxID=2608715 RepID=UPI0015A2BBBF|nr:hypothetical protein [Mariprofundus sp. KV]NWF36202.1 hypothetical protein [Mariprofundus sp. KV]